jgi:hypothetical protein
MKLTKRQEIEKTWINSFIMRGIEEEDLDRLTIAVTEAFIDKERKR